MPEQLVLDLRRTVPAFLDKWERGMALAGYLQSTTAKREDCIRSYNGFLEPLWERLERGLPLEDFPALLQNNGGWADGLIQMSHRHRLRGVTPEMFIGCFTTLVQAVEGAPRGNGRRGSAHARGGAHHPPPCRRRRHPAGGRHGAHGQRREQGPARRLQPAADP
jgi:hypothetical protein